MSQDIAAAGFTIAAGAVLVLLEYYTPLDEGIAVLYPGLVMIGLLATSPRLVLAFSALASLLVFVGAYVSYLVKDLPTTIEARAFTIMMIWVAGFAIHRQLVVASALRADKLELERRALDYGSEAIQRNQALGTKLERRQGADEAVAEGDERLRSIFDDAPVIIHVIDEKGRIVEVSNHWLIELGYAKSEVVGRKLSDFVDETSRSSIDEIWSSDGDDLQNNAREFDCRFVKNGGEIMETSFTSTPERRVDRTRFWGVLKDITESNRIHRELLEHEALYHAVFNQTFQFIVLLGPDGHVREANDTMREFAGETHRALTGRDVWDVADWAGTPEAEEKLRSAVADARQGNFVRDEITIAGLAESELTIDFSMKPVRDAEGNVEVLIFEGRDVTEHRQQQEMLIQAQKMEAVGALTSGVAHDFNNILTIIAGNLQLLQKRVDGDERIDSRFEKAIEAVFRGQTLTQQLLAFSREQQLRPTAVDVETLIVGMAEIFGTVGEGIEIEHDIAENLWPCWVDPNQLETVLLNFVINARDAMPEGGKVTISCKNVEFDESILGAVPNLARGRYIRIAVTDTGTGMPREVAENAFDPFFTTKESGKGTGLGLSMAYGFAKQSGGDIGIYSEENKGTTVRLYLPKSDHPAVEASGAAESEGSTPAERRVILVVEDDDQVRDIAVTALRDAGHEVEEVADGESAIAILRAGRRFDLLFTDVVLSGDHDGTDVATLARAIQPAIKVLYTSGYPRRPLGDTESKVRGAAFLAKPYRHEDLLTMVEAAIAQPV